MEWLFRRVLPPPGADVSKQMKNENLDPDKRIFFLKKWISLGAAVLSRSHLPLKQEELKASGAPLLGSTRWTLHPFPQRAPLFRPRWPFNDHPLYRLCSPQRAQPRDPKDKEEEKRKKGSIT